MKFKIKLITNWFFLIFIWLVSLINYTFANDIGNKTIANEEVLNKNTFSQINSIYFKYRKYELTYDRSEELLSNLFENTKKNKQYKKWINNLSIKQSYIKMVSIKINNIESMRDNLLTLLYSKVNKKIDLLIEGITKNQRTMLINNIIKKIENIKSMNTINLDLLNDRKLTILENNIIKYKTMLKSIDKKEKKE